MAPLSAPRSWMTSKFTLLNFVGTPDETPSFDFGSGSWSKEVSPDPGPEVLKPES